MSHEATNWAIKQRGLKPTTKIVLWHLCDRYNPDYGCFPSQDRLAHDCEISRSTLNDHLGQLEAGGMLRRVPRIDPATKRQLPTRYILGFEPGFTPADVVPCPQIGHGLAGDEETTVGGGTCGMYALAESHPCPDFGHGIDAEAVSGFCPKPCPENAESRVRIPDTNLVREPLSKPVKEEEDAQARDADFDRFYEELLSALGFAANATHPAWWQGWPAKAHVRRWADDLGLSEARIIEVATETRGDHPNPPDGPKALDRFMERAAQRDALNAAANGKRAKQKSNGEAARPLSDDEKAAFYAKMVNADGYLPQSVISNSIRDAMLARGLVTPERLRERGVR
jgi:Helix-turn-helix domain